MSSTHPRDTPMTWRRIKDSADWWTVGISIVALLISIFTFIDSEHDARQEARIQAAYNTCITYTADDGMRTLTDEISEGENNKVPPSHRFDLALQDTAAGKHYKHLLLTWMNYLDMVATGLNTGALNKTITRACFAPLFLVAREDLMGKGKVFPVNDWIRIAHWADKYRHYLGNSRE